MSKTLAVIAVAAGLVVGSSAINRADAMPLGDISGVRTIIDDLNITDKALTIGVDPAGVGRGPTKRRMR